MLAQGLPSATTCDPNVQSCAPNPGPNPIPSPAPPPSCGPGKGGGATCGGTGPASLGNSSGTNQGAGNPINVIHGNKYQREDDMPALPGVLGLEIVRHYNSAWHALGQSGYCWRLSYETDLFVVGNTVQIRQADGTELIFNRDPKNPSSCSSANPANGHIQIQAGARGEEYIWHWTTGRKLAFNHQGWLESITETSGEFVSLQRGPKGELLKVTDPQGRSLVLEYAKPGVQGFRGIVAMQSPLGRFVLEHNNDTRHPGLSNLVAVTSPQGTSRRYHYGGDAGEAHPKLAHYLTGISVQSQDVTGNSATQRINTWAYDAQGRGILSVRGLPRQSDADGHVKPDTGIEQVELDFRTKGRTVLTNSLGQVTTYQHAIVGNTYRLLEVRGAGCASCGPSNVRYGYDTLGRLNLETDLTPSGEPVRSTKTELDSLGRTVRVSRIDYVKGKPRAAQWTSRYEYAGQATQPSLVAWPSVAPGKEHQLRITYNDAGQTLSVTETGFSPMDDKGQFRAAGLSRTTTYRYQRINGRSVLVQFDGPLKNGPKADPGDSDITTLSYDGRANYVVAITQPGGFKSTLTYDDAGRIAGVQNDGGFKTSITLDAAGRATQISSQGPGWTQPKTESFSYDRLGQPSEAGTGIQVDNSYKPQTRQSYDALGRLQWSASTLGILTQYRYDSESRLIESGRYSNRMAQVEGRAYDALGRLSEVWNNTGARYAISDAPGAATRPGPKAPLPSSATVDRPRDFIDDFGRVVMSTSADSGSSYRSFDEADRLVASTDAQGNRARYEYDAAGRIARQTITDAASKQDSVTTWTYLGKHLVAMDHPTQSERYAYDARGLRTARIVTLNGEDGSQHSAVTRYEYDEKGALQATTLPDGSRLQYERNGQGQVVALQRSRLQTPWLQWLLPKQTLVQDLQRDIVGLSSYTTGNGIQALYQRSPQGVLARVVYRHPRALAPPTLAQATPILLGRSTKESIGLLLGLGLAHAAVPPAGAAAFPAATTVSSKSSLPGALGLPQDPQALLDQRYLWDTGGNLLFNQRRSQSAAADPVGYAYDDLDRLIVATGSAGTSRYFYQGGRRVLSQEGVADQADLSSNTRKVRFEPGTHRWAGDSVAVPAGAVAYSANGQPKRIGEREYVWDALGRLIAVRCWRRT